MRNPVVDFISGYLARYPVSEIRDLYKTLYHAFHGPGHAINDIEATAKWLRAEWDGIPTVPGNENCPLLEPVFIERVTPPLYRLNLKPAKSAGINSDLVLGEFIRTAGEFPENYPDESTNLHLEFIKVWGSVGNIITDGGTGLDYFAYAEFSKMAADSGWVAMHHSGLFREKYDPHYRLVMNPEFYR